MSSATLLIVDLETGLLRTDLAREGFWRALADGRWGEALGGGAASLLSVSEIASLPMNPSTVAAMAAARDAGARVVLVSAGSPEVAHRFAQALDTVDEAIGGAPGGTGRADWLASRFEAGGYDYVGAGAQAVAPQARQAIEPGQPELTARPYIRALRPHQWVKNLLVFLPMIAAHRLDLATATHSLIAFIAFSLVASSVYLLNDLLDLSADRAHPRKRYRPMASGAVPLGHAGAMAMACMAAGFAAALFAGPIFVAVLCAYTILTTAYSLRLKREPVIDICVLAALYTMRIVAGSAATGIPLSVWLLAFAIFIFLSLAAMKRQIELVDNLQSGNEKPAGRGYRVADLPIVEMMAVTAGYVAVLVLALYLNAPNVAGLYTHPEILWAVCAVLLYWISRAVMIAHRGEMHDDPIVFALRDRVSHVCGAAILVALAAAALW